MGGGVIVTTKLLHGLELKKKKGTLMRRNALPKYINNTP